MKYLTFKNLWLAVVLFALGSQVVLTSMAESQGNYSKAAYELIWACIFFAILKEDVKG